METTRMTIARWKSGKTPNCHGESQPQREKTDMRMKPDWLNDSSAAAAEATAEGSYTTPCRDTFPLLNGGEGMNWPRRNCNKQIKERKSHPTISRANSYYTAKRGLPKSESLKAMSKGSEYPTWQRSLRSSSSEGKPRTWRREAVDSLSINKRNT
ncbi:MAG: hypothetical protein NC116_10435 [Clostridium sp.]|nr:hypothetical protein [Clostridium sp.]